MICLKCAREFFKYMHGNFEISMFGAEKLVDFMFGIKKLV